MRRLVIFCGIPGSGKTTIAKILASKLPRACHIQTDVVRAMISHPEFTGPESRFVYGASMGMGRGALMAGYDTILDGTFPREEFRMEALRRLGRLSTSQLVVHVSCDRRVALARNANRESVVPEESVARIHQRFQAPRHGLRLDSTSTPPGENADAVIARLEGLEPGPISDIAAGLTKEQSGDHSQSPSS